MSNNTQFYYSLLNYNRLVMVRPVLATLVSVECQINQLNTTSAKMSKPFTNDLINIITAKVGRLLLNRPGQANHQLS